MVMLGRGEFANALQMKGGRIAGGRRARAGAATRSNFRAAPELEYQIFLAQFQDAWSFYEHADGDVRADLRETAPQ